MRTLAIAAISLLAVIFISIVISEGIAASRHAQSPLHSAELTATYLARWSFCLNQNRTYDSGRHYRFEIGMTMEEAAAIVGRYYPEEFPATAITPSLEASIDFGALLVRRDPWVGVSLTDEQQQELTELLIEALSEHTNENNPPDEEQNKDPSNSGAEFQEQVEAWFHPSGVDELLSFRYPEVRWWFNRGRGFACLLSAQAIELLFDEGRLVEIEVETYYDGP